MTPTYLGDIDLNEETLAHFGVKGMKWGKRKAKLKSDLKWQVSKLKNKKLELQTKRNRKKRNIKPDELSIWNGKTAYNTRYTTKVDNGKAISTTRPTGNLAGRDKSGKIHKNIEDNTGYSKQPNKKTTYKAWSKYTYKDVSSNEGPKYKGVQKKYSGGEKWQPRTNAERTAKSNDDFINSKGGQELLKVYKRKKAMSSRKSTKA